MFGPNFQVEEGTPRMVSCVLLQVCRVRLNLGRVYVGRTASHSYIPIDQSRGRSRGIGLNL